jgi:hypothetical protein
VHFAPSSRLCALALSALSTLYSRHCALALYSRTLCTLDPLLLPLHSDSVLSHCALIVHCARSSRICALALSALSTLNSLTLCTHNLCALASVPSHSLYSRLCTLVLAALSVLSHCALIVHSAPSSRLRILALSALSILHSL